MNNQISDKKKEICDKLKQINENLEEIIDESGIPSQEKTENKEKNNTEVPKVHKITEQGKKLVDYLTEEEKRIVGYSAKEVCQDNVFINKESLTVPMIDSEGNPIRMKDGKFIKDYVTDSRARHRGEELVGEPIRMNHEKRKIIVKDGKKIREINISCMGDNANNYIFRTIHYEEKEKIRNKYKVIKKGKIFTEFEEGELTYSKVYENYKLSEKDYENINVHDTENPEVIYKDRLLDEFEGRAEQTDQERLEDKIDEEEFDLRKNAKKVEKDIQSLEREYSKGELNEDDFNSKYQELLKKKGALKRAASKQHLESGCVITKLSDKEKKEYKNREQELVENREPLITLYVEKAFITNKWLGLLPGAKAAKENWNVQGRPGWEIPDKGLFKILRALQIEQVLGQPKQYSGCEQNEVFTHYVYIEDHRKENPERQLMYKMSSRKKLHEGKDDEGNPYYSELWKYTKKSSEHNFAWEVINRLCENFKAENSISAKIGNTYRNGRDGLLSLTAEAMGEQLKIFERSKSIREILDIGRSYFMTLPFENIPANVCEIDRDVFKSYARGTQFSVIDKDTNYMYAKIKKDRIKSWLRSGLALLMPFKDKHRLGKWKMENYKIEIYDKNFAGSAIAEENLVVDEKTGSFESDHLAGMLTMFTPMLEREREYHNYRFKFKGKPGKDHPSLHKGNTTYETFEKYPLKE